MRTLGLMAILALVAACGKDSSDDSTAGTPTGSTEPSTGSTTPNTGVVTSPLRSATLTANLLSCNGGAAPDGFDIRFCDPQVCRYLTTENGDNTVVFEDTLIGWNSFEAVDKAGNGYATGFVPLELGDGEARELDITLCPHDTPTPLTGTATEIELGEGLYVTLSTGSIAPPMFVDPPTEAAGVRLADSGFVPTDGITGTVVAQWFVDPFNHTATGADLPIRFDGPTIGLTGATYRAYVGSYDDFAWLDAGTFSDGDADGWFTNDGGTGLVLLGTVVLVEE